jgi:hypothetical protein
MIVLLYGNGHFLVVEVFKIILNNGRSMMTSRVFAVDSEKWPRKVKILGLFGASLQMTLAFCIGFLPVFAVCTSLDIPCRYRTYAEQGGSLFGYLIFTTMIVLGVLVIASLVSPYMPHKTRLLWIGTLASWIVVILSAWGLGITFLPGAILLLYAALSSRTSALPKFQ